jgi:hypothetical protein
MVMQFTEFNGNQAITKARNRAKVEVQMLKNKACPAKRKEYNAWKQKKMEAAKMRAIGTKQVCQNKRLNYWTMGEMDVDQPAPTFGLQVKNEWMKAKARYSAAMKKHAAATKAHKAAKEALEAVMAGLKTALVLEASAQHRICTDEHSAYARLNRDVQSNVRTRKQVWISTLVIKCYMKHVRNNAAAKRCVTHMRRANTSRWNINPTPLPVCLTPAKGIETLGPANWRPTGKICKGEWKEEVSPSERRAKERQHKQLMKKEKAYKERSHKRPSDEKEFKERRQKTGGERSEKAGRIKERKMKAAKERKTKEESNPEYKVCKTLAKFFWMLGTKKLNSHASVMRYLSLEAQYYSFYCDNECHSTVNRDLIRSMISVMHDKKGIFTIRKFRKTISYKALGLKSEPRCLKKWDDDMNRGKKAGLRKAMVRPLKRRV